MQTLLLGLDGVCRPVLDPLVEDDVVPALSSLLEVGAAGPLRSQIPPWTPSAWPSLYTGVNPGKHGVYGFLRFDGYDWDVVNRTDVRAHALWELLDRHDRTSVVVNVPVTSPPRPFDGALIPGYVAPADPPCHPAGLLADVRQAVGEYSVYGPLDHSGEADLDEVASVVRARGGAFRYLADRFDPDFGFLQFQATDTVFHVRPDDERAIRAVFEAVDDAIGTVLDACDPDVVVLASDHGIGEYRGYEFRVNEYLRDRGFAVGTPEGEGMPSWDAIARNRLQEGEDGGRPTPGLLERATRLAARAGLTSQRIAAVLEPLGLAEVVAEVVPTDAIRAGTEQVDFAASRASMRSRIECGVRINLAGREPDGTVSPDEYDAVRADLIETLAAAHTPDGEPVFDAVLPREEVYSGPFLEAAPDVVVVPAGFEHFLNGSLLGDVFGPPSERWNHKRDGILAIAGAGIDGDGDLAGAHLFDVAPTVLSSLDVPPAGSMDGDVLAAVDPVPATSYPDFEGRDRAVTDDRAVEERLANLGYLAGDGS